MTISRQEMYVAAGPRSQYVAESDIVGLPERSPAALMRSPSRSHTPRRFISCFSTGLILQPCFGHSM